MYVPDKATPQGIIGRAVGDLNDHIAVAVVPNEADPKTGYLLAVRPDGEQYVTWAYGWNMAEDGVNVWSGNYFLTGHYDSPFDAFEAARANLLDRKIGVSR
jgi:hypothetical protein